jgi:hypothetical protein
MEFNPFGAAAIRNADGLAGAKFWSVLVAEANANQIPTLHFLVSGPRGVRNMLISDPRIILTEREKPGTAADYGCSLALASRGNVAFFLRLAR